jgi:membrane-anchored protein YejM (alkaline phosphatase superfamily)
MDNARQNQKKQLYIVFIFNVVILLILSKKYSAFFENADTLFTKFYLTITTFSHFFLLGTLPLLLSLTTLLLTKSNRISNAVHMLFSVVVLLVVQIDATIFGQFRYHLSPIVLKLVFGKRSGDIFQFSAVNLIISALFVGGLIGIQFLFFYLSKKIIARNIKLRVKATFAFFIFATLFSHCVYAWSDANYYRPVTQVRNVFPVFYPLTADDLLASMGLVDEEKAKRNKELTSTDFSNKTVDYPLHPIVSTTTGTRKNILYLIVDTWRYNCMTEAITPTIYNFSKRCQVFDNHISGSNMTTGGVFSLFYGIPATYFDTFTGQEIAPVFMNELQKQQYDLLIYGSSGLENPPFNRNVFAKVPNLRVFSKGENPSDRDLTITTEWMAALEKQDPKKPFFGYLFYDSAHGFDLPKDYKLKFKPSLAEVNYLDMDDDYDPTLLYNRYLNSLHYIDELMGKVLAQLEQKGMLENTLIVITGDHGQEFNDCKKGYWQHGGNFSKFQIRTPMMVFDASKAPKTYHHQTIHYDITATLLKDYMGVQNDLNDFSFGKDLYVPNQRDYFICGYNQKFAIIEKNKITNIYPSGLFDVTDGLLNPLKDENINYDLVTEGLSEMNRFFVKK